MRTTVTLDPDTEFLLREETQKTGKSFKAVLNEAVRDSLTKKKKKYIKVEPLFKGPLPEGFDDINFNHYADEISDQHIIDNL